MKRKLIIVGSFVGIIAISVAISSFFSSKKSEEKEKPSVKFNKMVNVEKVKNSKISTFIYSYGRVITSQSIKLMSEVSGRLIQGTLELKEGEKFKKGQLLYSIDDKEERLSLNAKKSNFLRDLVKIIPDIKLDFADSYPQWESFLNDFKIDQNIKDLPVPKSEKEKIFLASRNILSAYYEIKISEIRINKFDYYAPFDGSVKSVNLQVGSFVSMGAQIAEVIRTGKNEIKVSVEARDVPYINRNNKVTIYSENNERFIGHIIRISDYVNQNTQSADVFVSIEDNLRTYEGQYFEVSIKTSTDMEGFMLPRNCIMDNNLVFVVKDSLLVTKPVTLGRIQKDQVVVLGLEDGEYVVNEQLMGVFENTKVSINNIDTISNEKIKTK